MFKRFLIVGAFLGAGLFTVGAGTVLGVVLGTRAIVVSAAAVKPAAILSIAPTRNVGSLPILVATRDATAAAH